MRPVIMAILIVLILSAQGDCETKIYTWTDKNGVKQFSDQAPEDVDTYELITSDPSQEKSAGSGSEKNARPGYKRMILDVQNENRQTDLENEQAEKDRQKDRAQQAQLEKEAKQEAQRQRIQKKIDALNRRGLSPTFSKGMRDSQIKTLQEQLEAIK